MRSGWVGKVWARLVLLRFSFMRLGSSYRRLWNVSYLSIMCIIVKCRSLTKAIFFLQCK
jgi:hypothetical protein